MTTTIDPRHAPYWRASAIKQARGILDESHAAGVPVERDVPQRVGALEWAVSALLELVDDGQSADRVGTVHAE